jgi:hypothetical protein
MDLIDDSWSCRKHKYLHPANMRSTKLFGASSKQQETFSQARSQEIAAKQEKPICIQSISLFDLPREVRDFIYFHTLHPDYRMSEGNWSGQILRYKECSKVHHYIKSGLGCTKILVLNTQVHFEAIGFLNAFENIIRISGRSNKVFRDRRSWGKPGFFACDSKTSQCPLGPNSRSFRSCAFDISLLSFDTLILSTTPVTPSQRRASWVTK